MSRQYVACKFRSTDTRSFTYINDGEPVAIGDFVKVPDARSTDGSWKRVQVVTITDEAPPFTCKPILGRIDPDAEIAAAIHPAPSGLGLLDDEIAF